MKNTLHYNFLLMLVLCCWSCGPGEEEGIPAPTPEPESTKIEILSSGSVIEQKGGSTTVSFTTNAVWTANVANNANWVTVSPVSGTSGTHTLTVTASENTEYNERNTSLTIKSGIVSKTVTIAQKQKDALLINSNKVELGKDGGSFNIQFQSNVSISYEIEETAKDWLSSSDSRGLSTHTLNFTAKANDKVERRQGNILLKGDGGLTETVTVYQEGEEPTLVLTTAPEMTIGSEGGTLKIELQSNLEDVQMIMPDLGWLRESSSRSTSSYTYYVEVDANDTYDDRNATVTFTAGSLNQTVTIIQKQKDAMLISSNKVELGKDGGNFSIQFQSNVSVSYEIEESAKDWLSSSDSRGLSTHSLNFMAKANDKVERRQGNILLKSDSGLTETVTVYQEGEEPSLVLTTASEMTVGSEGGVLKIELQSNLGDVQMELPVLGWLRESSSRSVSSYTYYVEVDANDTYDDRNATVTFTAGDLKQTVTITQKQKDALFIGQDVYTVSAKGEQIEFSVSANVDYEVKTSVDWIQRNVESRGLVENKIAFTVAENTSSEPREGEIIISNGHLEQKIQVIQEGAFVPIVTISQSEYELDASKQSLKIEIPSNIDIEFEVSDDWISIVGNRPNYVKLSIKSNDTPKVRTAIIIVKNDDYGIRETIKVVQKPIVPYINISKKSFDFDYNAHEDKIEVSTNVEISFKTSEDWVRLSIYQYQKQGNERIYYYSLMINENSLKESRTANITFYNKEYDVSDVVVIKQARGNTGGNIDDMEEIEWK